MVNGLVVLALSGAELSAVALLNLQRFGKSGISDQISPVPGEKFVLPALFPPPAKGAALFSTTLTAISTSH